MTPTSLLRSFIVGIIFGVIVSVFSFLATSVITLVVKIFGIKQLQKVHAEVSNDLTNVTSGLPSASDVSPTIKGEHKDELNELRNQVIDWLSDNGLSVTMAHAASSQRSRLSWSREQWMDFIQQCNSLLREGVKDEIINLHLRIAGTTPTFQTTQNLDFLRESGLSDPFLLCHVVSREFSVEDVERVIYLHDVDQLPWEISVRTVTTDIDIRQG